MAEELVIRLSAIDNFSNTFDKVNRQTEEFNRKARIAGTVLAGMGVALGGLLLNATLTAARTQTLGVALEETGKRAGYSKKELSTHEKTIKDLGITTQSARTIMMRFIQSQLDLKDAAKLSRVAQDLAVIGLVNSSEAMETLTNAIASQEPMLLRQFGIVRNLPDIYLEYGRQIGIVTQEIDQNGKATNKWSRELTEAEKKQAMLNVIMKEGEKVAGAYEASMGTAGKVMLSMERVIEETKNVLGRAFLPVLSAVVFTTYKALEAFNELSPRMQDIISVGAGVTSTVLLLSGGFLILISYLQKGKAALDSFIVSMQVHNITLASGALALGKVAAATYLVALGIKMMDDNSKLNLETIREENKRLGIWRAVLKDVVRDLTLGTVKIWEKKTASDSLKETEDKLEKSFRQVSSSVQELTTLLSPAQEASLRLQEAHANMTLANQRVEETQKRYNEAVALFGPNSKEAQTELANLDLAKAAAVRAADSFQVAQRKNAEEIQKETEKVKALRTEIIALPDGKLITIVTAYQKGYEPDWLRKGKEIGLYPKWLQRGGWATKGIYGLGEAGPELVLPHEVSSFFKRVGIPITMPERTIEKTILSSASIPRGAETHIIHTHTYLDGKQIADVVDYHQAGVGENI